MTDFERDQYWVGNIYNLRSVEEEIPLQNNEKSIKPNHVYRGGFYFNQGESDFRALKEEKGICALVDLRSSDEVPEDFGRRVNTCGLEFYNAPLIPFWRSVWYMLTKVPIGFCFKALFLAVGSFFQCKFHLFIQQMKSSSTTFPLGWYYPVIYMYGKKELNGLFKFIARNSDKPFIFYCAFGKDRTGLIGCMIEMLLGASLDECIRDYKLSDRSLDHHMVVAKDHFKTFGGDEKGIELAKTDEQLIIDFYNYVQEKYGSIEKYFTDFIGLTEDEIDIIRKNCLVEKN